jgi:hypothetical protein
MEARGGIDLPIDRFSLPPIEAEISNRPNRKMAPIATLYAAVAPITNLGILGFVALDPSEIQCIRDHVRDASYSDTTVATAGYLPV